MAYVQTLLIKGLTAPGSNQPAAQQLAFLILMHQVRHHGKNPCSYDAFLGANWWRGTNQFVVGYHGP